MEIILVLFIASFIYRAIPNVDVLPALHSEYQIDDLYWGKYVILEFESHCPLPPTPGKAQTSKTAPGQASLRTFLIQPKKFWLWYPIGTRV
jgi:hypothetical protein